MQHALWSSHKWYSVDHLPNSSPKCPNLFILIRRFKGDKFVNELERNVTCVAHLEDLIWMNCWETVFYMVLVWVIMLKLTYWGLEQIWFLLFIEELMLTDLPGGFFSLHTTQKRKSADISYSVRRLTENSTPLVILLISNRAWRRSTQRLFDKYWPLLKVNI